LNGCTGFGRAIKPDSPAQALRHNVVHDVQAEAGRAFATAGSEEWIERLALDVGTHTTSIVGKQKLDMIASNRTQLDIDRSSSAAGECMRHGIDGEIRKNLPKRFGVAVHRKIWLASDIEPDIALLKFPLKMRENLFNQFTGVEAARWS